VVDERVVVRLVVHRITPPEKCISAPPPPWFKIRLMRCGIHAVDFPSWWNPTYLLIESLAVSISILVSLFTKLNLSDADPVLFC
jgi:hypothetical protein